MGIKPDGTLWSWGGNDYGILGLGDTTDRTTPQQVGSDKWISVSLGWTVCVGIKEDGTLWGWGRNNSGQFGAFATGEQHSPVQLGTDTWIAADACYNHFLAIRSDGAMFAGGSNTYKQLGVGPSPYTYATFPAAVAGGHTWRKVTTGPFNSAGITTSNELYVWGEGGNYVTGVYYPTDYDAPNKIDIGALWTDAMIGREYIHAIQDDGTLWVWGNGSDYALGTGSSADVRLPTYLPFGLPIHKVSPGYYASFVLAITGAIYTAGKYQYNGLGGSASATTLTEMTGFTASDIYGGEYNSFFLSGTPGPQNFWTNFAGQTEIV